MSWYLILLLVILGASDLAALIIAVAGIAYIGFGAAVLMLWVYLFDLGLVN